MMFDFIVLELIEIILKNQVNLNSGIFI